MVLNVHLFQLMEMIRWYTYFATLLLAFAPALAFAGRSQTWSASSRLTLDQGFQKFAKANSVNSFNVSYEIPTNRANTHSLDLSLIHSYAWDEFEDQHPNQIESIDMSYGFSHKLNSNDEMIYSSIDFGAPVSERDRISGFQGSLDGTIGYRNRLGFQSFDFSAVATAYSFKYDTADLAGSLYNKKSALLARAVYGLHLSKRFTWGNRIDLNQYVNVAGTTHNEYYLSTGPSFAWTQSLNTFAKVITTDAIETYKTPLDERITSARVGLEWSI